MEDDRVIECVGDGGRELELEEEVLLKKEPDQEDELKEGLDG
jgi:hypothetical protein